jgi:prepilin-type N-terminal cleavage/methylation domain-containing protein
MTWRRLGSIGLQSGYTLVEMLLVMSILGLVMTGLGTLFVQASNAELDVNRKFQAQQAARTALDKLRRDLHCATTASASSSTSVTVNDACVSGGVLTWCVQALNGRTQLFRNVGSTCPTTAPRFADYLLSGRTYFAYQAPSTTTSAFLYVCIPVSTNTRNSVETYALQDRIVFRNSTRSGSASTVSQPACP